MQRTEAFGVQPELFSPDRDRSWELGWRCSFSLEPWHCS